MCGYCGCQAVSVIEELTFPEHVATLEARAPPDRSGARRGGGHGAHRLGLAGPAARNDALAT